MDSALRDINVSPRKYLKIMKYIASKIGYDANKLLLSSDGVHKLEYNGVKFGNMLYKDYVIYLLLDGFDVAHEHRRKYLKRATKIKGDWRDNMISPNNLAIRIIWDGDDILNKSRFLG